MRAIVFFSALSILIDTTQTLASEQIVDVTKSGAKGDGKTDDTNAIQKAIDFSPEGATIRFPPGIYVVSSVGLKPGRTYLGERATILRPANQDKWTRTFTTDKDGYTYSSDRDSALLIIKGLRFDGNRSQQGPYTNYELEHAHMIFLDADPAKKGRLKVRIHDCHFRECVADGLSLWANVDAEVTSCSSYNCFRGGFVLTGGNSRVVLTDFTSDGDAHSRGIDIEVDGDGFKKSKRVEVTMKKLRLKDGNFDIAVEQGSQITGEDIISHGSFCIYAEKSIVRLKDSSFGVGRFSDTDNRIVRPGQCEFVNCTFTSRQGLNEAKDRTNKWATIHLYWNFGDSKLTGQSVIFDRCTFNTDKIPASDLAYAFYVEPDHPSCKNTLIVREPTIASRFDVPYEILGGRLRIEKTKQKSTESP
jgi:hypothetical protein